MQPVTKPFGWLAAPFADRRSSSTRRLPTSSDARRHRSFRRTSFSAPSADRRSSRRQDDCLLLPTFAATASSFDPSLGALSADRFSFRLRRRCRCFFGRSLPLLPSLVPLAGAPPSTVRFIAWCFSVDHHLVLQPPPLVKGATPKKSREFSMDEPTMAEKLSSLELLNKENIESKSIPESTATVEPPRADSLHVLLKQALHADDHSLLLDCLYTRDEKVIAKSIALLNPASAVKLLKSLISMAEARGAVMVCTLPWIRALLCQQAGSLILQESSLPILNSLYQLIESRISTFGTTMQLSSCLDHLLPWGGDDETDDGVADQPIIYENSDDEESSKDAMETDGSSDSEEGPGDFTDAHNSDQSVVMSD